MLSDEWSSVVLLMRDWIVRWAFEWQCCVVGEVHPEFKEQA